MKEKEDKRKETNKERNQETQNNQSDIWSRVYHSKYNLGVSTNTLQFVLFCFPFLLFIVIVCMYLSIQCFFCGHCFLSPFSKQSFFYFLSNFLHKKSACHDIASVFLSSQMQMQILCHGKPSLNWVLPWASRRDDKNLVFPTSHKVLL